jgi:hypothetical protein
MDSGPDLEKRESPGRLAGAFPWIYRRVRVPLLDRVLELVLPFLP